MEGHVVADDDFINKVGYVLSFLHQAGLSDVQTVLLSALEDRFPGASSAQASAGAEERPSTSQGQLHSAAGLGLTDLNPIGLKPQKKRNPKHFPKQSVPWDDAVDEYETVEDVGYLRKEVSVQQQFEDLELDLHSEHGRDSEHFFTHQPGTSTRDEEETFEDADDGEGTSMSSSNASDGASVDLSPHHSITRSSRNVTVDGDSGKLAPADEAWDLGPMDIKLAAPVTTPRKSSPGKQQEESRPVLSRVESLSSSFKDFDIERNDDEPYFGRVSGVLSDADMQGQPDPEEVIDFQPIPLAQVTPQDLEAFSLLPSSNAPAPTASTSTSMQHMDGFSLVPPVPKPPSVGEQGTSKSSVVDEPSTTEKKPERGEDIKENGGGFSFFPVTPPSAEPQPVADSKLFKSWPSVRSSCTSELIAASDDDNTAADYADDDYSKSVSKPASRSPSQNLSDVLHKAVMATSAADDTDGTTGDLSAPSGWSFHTRRQQKSDPSNSKSKLEREPSLDLVAPQSKSSGMSSISEPCKGVDFNNSKSQSRAQSTPSSSSQPLNAGSTGMSGALSAGGVAEAKPGSEPRTASSPIKAEGTSSAPATPTSPPATASSKASDALTKDKEASLGGAAQLELPVPEPGQSPAASTGSQPSENKGVVADVVAHMIQLSLESLPMSPGSQQGRDGDEDPDQQLSSQASQAGAGYAEDADDDKSEDEDGVESAAAIRLAEVDEAVAAAQNQNWLDVQAHPVQSPSQSEVAPEQLSPRYTVDENGVLTYEYDPAYIARKYEVFDLRIYHRRHRTGFEETKDFPIRMNDLIAGRYQVMDFLGSAAFSRAVQALDTKTGMLVCLKIIKNNKDYFDQSLDEIKLLKFVNAYDPDDKYNLVRLYDYFYFKEHLFLVCELLRANLYEFQKYNRESGEAPYFTNARIQRIARQVLSSLGFLHSLGLIHSDLKPENILIKSYSRCEVKVIDLGSSCFITDQLSSYVQSRSYRAPEVILGLPYDQKVDVWSLGCILAELSSGFVLFQNDSLSTLLARLEGILGPMPEWMIRKGRYSNRFYTRSGQLYEKNATSEKYELLVPKRSSLRHRVPDADEGLLSFISCLLHIDPHKRPSAAEALQHPWLQKEYLTLEV